MPICPLHNTPMRPIMRDSGKLWVCRDKSCDIKKWDHTDATPADDATRARRGLMHELFDPLWKTDKYFTIAAGPNTKEARRDRAYWWLANRMGLTRETCHFGLFDIAQCERAERHIKKLIKSKKRKRKCNPIT